MKINSSLQNFNLQMLFLVISSTANKIAMNTKERTVIQKNTIKSMKTQRIK